MRNNLMKRRLEYTMLVGIIINALSFFLPIVSLTLTSETKHYTESYSFGSLIKLLVPAVLNGGKGGLSNPPLGLMAVMLLGMICWIASLFTVILVIQSMRARKVNLFRTIAVSVFELLSGVFFLIFAAQMKTFAIEVTVEPFFGHVRTSFSMLGMIPALVTVILAFVNIFLLLSIIRSGEDFDEIDEEETPASHPAARERQQSYPYGDRRPARPSADYARTRQPQRQMPTDAYPPQRTPVRNNIYSGEAQQSANGAARPQYDGQRAARPTGATGVIDRNSLPRQTAYGDSAQRTAQRPAAQQVQTVTCPKCGAKCRRGTRFCNICGEPLTRPVRRCSACGEIISEKDVFCPSCGANIR